MVPTRSLAVYWKTKCFSYVMNVSKASQRQRQCLLCLSIKSNLHTSLFFAFWLHYILLARFFFLRDGNWKREGVWSTRLARKFLIRRVFNSNYVSGFFKIFEIFTSKVISTALVKVVFWAIPVIWFMFYKG